MRRLLRRLFPPGQTSRCSGCGVLITERRRRPCPACGSPNRSVSVTAADSMVADDKL